MIDDLLTAIFVMQLGENEPREEHQRDPEENFRQKLLLLILSRSRLLLTAIPIRRPHLIEIEAWSKESKWKSANSKR